MRHPYRTYLLVSTAVVLLTGCSTNHVFQLLLVVRDKSDGTPLPGATVVVDTLGVAKECLNPEHGRPLGMTDRVGRLTSEFGVSP